MLSILQKNYTEVNKDLSSLGAFVNKGIAKSEELGASVPWDKHTSI